VITLLGAGGFVGSAFDRLFAAEGTPCRRIEVGDYGAGMGEDCPILIHAAGNSRKYLADEDPVADFDQSVGLIVRVLRDYRPGLFVLLSSVDVYNELADPARTREATEINPQDLSAYGFHKLLAEVCARRAPRWIIFRLAGMVGPGLKKNPVHDILHGAPLRIHPDSLYQFLSTDAVARICWQVIRTRPPGEVWNVCGRGLISPREIAALADRGLDTSLLPPDASPRVVHVNTTKIEGLLDLPETAATIRDFIRQAREGRV
jgi:nucleoside-diphosphate-sugar epimerase